MLLGLAIGPVAIGPDRVVSELLSHVPFLGVHSSLSSQEAAIVLQLRLPRVVLALLVGAMLSMAGASYQGVFRNPSPIRTCSARPRVPVSPSPW